MSTRSNIAIRNADGSVTSIYCHWDGYPTNNGKILLRAYKTPTKIARLIKCGAISSLRDRLFVRKPYSVSKSADGTIPASEIIKSREREAVVAYSRDRHENWEYCKPTTYANEEEWRKGDLEEWGYLYKDGSWFVVDCHCKTEDRKIVPLTKSYIEDYDKSEKAEVLRYTYQNSEKPFTDADLRDKFAIRKKMKDSLLADGVLVKTKGGYAVR